MLSTEPDKERFNFSRLENIRRKKTRLGKFDKRIYQRRKLKLRYPLEVGEEVLFSHCKSEKKTILEDFTKAVWITSHTFIIKRHF